MHKKFLALLLALCLCLSLGSAALAAGGDTFTITYKTNAGAVMGTLEYPVGDRNNAFPTLATLGSTFSEFVTRAKQKGPVEVPKDQAEWWYSDQELTTKTTFPEGRAGESYTVYLKFTVSYLEANSVSNNAENKSYSEVKDANVAFLALSNYGNGSRDDAYEAAIAVFEKYENGEWATVDDSYYTDKSGYTWPNIIWFYNATDSGTYRLKYLRYTATDNDGNELYYADAFLPVQETYTVSIAPVELTISGVTATDRGFNGTNSVELSGGTLSGVLYGDDVSFELGTGTVADAAPGENKAVTTNIRLTGEKAGNYVLAQPTDVTVTITEAVEPEPAPEPAPTPTPKPEPKPTYSGTTTVTVGGETPSAPAPEENPNTGAYVSAVVIGILAAAGK